MPDEYKVPDDPDTGRMDAAYLRSCLGLRAKPGEPAPELPLAVRRAYCDMARSLSILGASGNSMTPTQLATVVTIALRDGAEAEQQEPSYSFDSELVTAGQKVVITFRNKARPAHFLRVENGSVIVLFDSWERKIRPDQVRLAKEGEFPEVAENINLPQLLS